MTNFCNLKCGNVSITDHYPVPSHTSFLTSSLSPIKCDSHTSNLQHDSVQRGAIGRGAGGAAPPPAFLFLARDMFLDRGATHFTLGLKPCIISCFPLKIYLRPPLKINQLLPWFCIFLSLLDLASIDKYLIIFV